MSTEAGTTLSASPESIRPVTARLSRSGRISRSDVAELSRRLSDNVCSQADAEALFALEGAAVRRCPEWGAFFVETVTDYVVWQCRPTGIVTESSARWLLDKVDTARTLRSFAVLVNVLSEAQRVPDWLFAAARSRVANDWPNLREAVASVTADERRAA